MPTDSGGNKLQEFFALFTACFGHRKRNSVKPFLGNEEVASKRWITLPKFRYAITSYVPRCKRVVRRNDAFMQALRTEQLLASGSTTSDNPIINICLGFKDEELRDTRPKIYHTSFAKTRWDRVLSGRHGLLRMTAYTTSSNEPIVDDLPASLWMECLEPTLAVLVSLSAMKHRRTNLSRRRSVTRSVNTAVREARAHHGDFNRDPWNNMAGPHFVFQQLAVLTPTEEVRPSRLLDFGGPVRVDIDIIVEPGDRTTRRNQQRNILTLPAQDPYSIEEDEPLAYTFPDESVNEDDSDDSFIDSSDDENVNQSASTAHNCKDTEIKFTTQKSFDSLNTNQNSSNKAKTRTWYWRSEIGQYLCSEIDDHTFEGVPIMQNNWLEYLNDLTTGNQTVAGADLLQACLSQHSVYRRMFLRDAVFFLEDIDAAFIKRHKQKLEKQAKLNQENTTSRDSLVDNHRNHLTVHSISNTSCERVDVDLVPLPESPIREKQLLSDGYVICNIAPRTYQSGSGTSIESVDTVEETDPFDMVKKMCKPKESNLHEAVVIVTDTYSLPVPTFKKKEVTFNSSKDSLNLLTVYASRSYEDITEVDGKASNSINSLHRSNTPFQQYKMEETRHSDMEIVDKNEKRRVFDSIIDSETQ